MIQLARTRTASVYTLKLLAHKSHTKDTNDNVAKPQHRVEQENSIATFLIVFDCTWSKKLTKYSGVSMSCR